MVNKAIIVGRLGRDPEVKYTNSGKAVANFSVATDETWKDQHGEKQKRTEWHKIVAWSKLAEIIQQYCKKGQLVYIEGKLQTRKWEKDGVERYSTEIVADTLRMLGGGRGHDDDGGHNESPAGQTRSSSKATTTQEVSDEDIPF